MDFVSLNRPEMFLEAAIEMLVHSVLMSPPFYAGLIILLTSFIIIGV